LGNIARALLAIEDEGRDAWELCRKKLLKKGIVVQTGWKKWYGIARKQKTK